MCVLGAGGCAASVGIGVNVFDLKVCVYVHNMRKFMLMIPTLVYILKYKIYNKHDLELNLYCIKK